MRKTRQEPPKPASPVRFRWMTEEEVKADVEGRLQTLAQNEAALKRREGTLAMREDKIAAREEAVEEIYKVGPGKPPLETRFKKGTTGNPGGRPKIKSLRAMFLKVANRRIGSTLGEEDGIDPETSKLEAAMHAMFESARLGDNVAMKRVLELTRAYIPEPGATEGVPAEDGPHDGDAVSDTPENEGGNST